MHDWNRLRADYDELADEGQRLAGGLADLGQRAAVYRHLFEHSGRNHVFPLIAAHGALWARGHFRFGARLGGLLNWPPRWGAARRRRLDALEAFADAFRDINRAVCAQTWASYYFTARHGRHPLAARLLEAGLLEALNRVHDARRAGRALSTARKRRVFEAFVLHEQRLVVGPRVAEALARFDWPLMRWLALRPRIRFAYFPPGTALWFRDFSNQAQRVENGLRAFDLAAAAGWEHVLGTLEGYAIRPDATLPPRPNRADPPHSADSADAGAPRADVALSGR